MRMNINGRASGFNSPNRFEKLHLEPIEADVQHDDDTLVLPTTFYNDTSKSILARNDSPDLDFTYSINPYRGCEHGCIYCYARPSHEYLGFSAGLDFETRIMVKQDAPLLLEKELQKKNWQPQMVAFSGNTDCYQPVERKLQLTRKCLEVFLKYRNPVGLITKNALVTRDIDILQEMTRLNLVHVMLSITTLDADLARAMEPRTSSPMNRLATLEALSKNGIMAGVNVAPIIPGLTDEEIPNILRAAAEHGATSAGYILLRLPGPVEPLFLDWLNRKMPAKAGRIINRIKDTRKGEMSDSRFGMRMNGEGEIAMAIQTLFKLSAQKYNLAKRWSGLSTQHFRGESKSQMNMF
ncbi:MAG: PA0069 family radical SAM protein [Ignavibacteriae bacterium]|nr:PA0069 family radical SAM protein [Ignavibacteriota bacterium]